MAGPKLADYLEIRERELESQISNVRGHLVPLETELAQVRKIRSLIADARAAGLTDLASDAVLPDPPVAESELSALALALDGQSPLAQSSQSPFAAQSPLAALAGPNQTIKQMILNALRDHFHEGATPTDLRDYMKTVYDRDIDRNSISPQLARLREDGMVDQLRDGKWKMSQQGRGIMRYSGTALEGLTKDSSDEDIARYIKSRGFEGLISIAAMRKQLQKG